MLTLTLGMNQLLTLCRKNSKKTLTLRKVYAPVRNTLIEGEVIKFSILPDK